jgi:hypothetical protein
MRALLRELVLKLCDEGMSKLIEEGAQTGAKIMTEGETRSIRVTYAWSSIRKSILLTLSWHSRSSG